MIRESHLSILLEIWVLTENSFLAVSMIVPVSELHIGSL